MSWKHETTGTVSSIRPVPKAAVYKFTQDADNAVSAVASSAHMNNVAHCVVRHDKASATTVKCVDLHSFADKHGWLFAWRVRCMHVLSGDTCVSKPPGDLARQRGTRFFALSMRRPTTDAFMILHC